MTLLSHPQQYNTIQYNTRIQYNTVPEVHLPYNTFRFLFIYSIWKFARYRVTESVFTSKGLSEDREYYLLDALTSGEVEINLSVLTIIISGSYIIKECPVMYY